MIRNVLFSLFALAVLSARSQTPLVVSYAADTNQTQATILELKDINGDRVGIVYRPVQSDDIAASDLILTHANIPGIGVALLQLIRQVDGKITEFIPYGDPRRSFDYWHDLTKKFVALLDSVAAPPNSTLPDGTPVPAAASRRPAVFRFGGIPLGVNVDSDSLKKARDGTAMIYAIAPNKVTAIGFFGAEGLVIMDKIGGEKGVRITAVGPILVIPKDPATFAENAAKLAVNPVKQQELYGQALKDLAKTIPGGEKLTELFGPFKVVIQQMGNLPILHTTVGHAVTTWSTTPAVAAAKTLGPIADVKIGGTTINHAAKSWTDNPGKAAEKTLKSLKPW